jgi:formylglycine-generating enzyme required for sulfatase activity
MTEVAPGADDAAVGPAPDDRMVWVPGGTFTMGSDRHYPEEAPAHRVAIDGFWIDRCAVTNREFRRFVSARGYVTLAERPPDPEAYPGALPERMVPASSVFVQPRHRVDLRDPYNWWRWVPGANWRHPRGSQSSLKGRDEHPVVHVAWEDVEAFAAWAGKQLPTEAEWEYAARGGLDGAEFAWGDEPMPGGRFLANWWQGEFPIDNQRLDGHEYTAPVRSFPPNGYGLFEMAGNVWEWTEDWYQERRAIAEPCCTIDNPRGGRREDSHDPTAGDPQTIPRKVMKGGSHLCADNYCRRYRPAARMAQAVDTSTSHLGFRCIVRPATAR